MVTNATVGGFFAFCSDISNNGSDCFQHGRAECRQYLSRAGSAIPILACQLGRRIRQRRGSSRLTAKLKIVRPAPDLYFPSIEIASFAAVPEPPVWAMMITSGLAGCGFAGQSPAESITPNCGRPDRAASR